jgi:hypothetical protein
MRGEKVSGSAHLKNVRLSETIKSSGVPLLVTTDLACIFISNPLTRSDACTVLKPAHTKKFNVSINNLNRGMASNPA